MLPAVNRPSPTSLPIRWGLGDFAWAWPATVFGQVVVGALLLSARGFGPKHQADAIDIAVITVGSLAVTVGALMALSRAKGQRSLRDDFGLRVRVADWPWFAGGILLQFVALEAVALITVVAGSAPKQDVARALEHSGTIAKVLGALAVVVAAPLAEELLFRGLLLRSLLRRFGAVAAVLVSGGVFALVHLLDPNTITLLAPLALVGVVSGIRVVRTGELSQSILLHAGFNCFTAAVLLLGL